MIIVLVHYIACWLFEWDGIQNPGMFVYAMFSKSHVPCLAVPLADYKKKHTQQMAKGVKNVVSLSSWKLFSTEVTPIYPMVKKIARVGKRH